ncbi:sulfotransferase 1B1-like isoform X1 [Argiope bruennichi]|uniref:Sulfotransferase family cytosolic 1B member 1 like protein n=1 Tax=Argiope bruennichi TaxID=94029 RepID=A0A8T0F7Z7_ARGBR|nr:sulfotransferase 1B1-like isoform X1 [Argiope bruennichi]XP_055942861.1 sulfotransferase 1B1-like isoform X1 [Argiope bruennichi]KAF8787307.1 Sulfotransferase family cytosolic 1B member 1 like protein [Argiope bruennichi]
MSRLQIIRGVPFPSFGPFKKENIEKTLDYPPRDGDIIIASYPKTGTTWLQYTLLQIVSKGESYPSFQDVLEKISPFMEVTGPEAIDNLTGLRMYKHHYRYDMVKKNPKAKVLYIYRNPADTLISFYHFIQGVWEKKIDFDEIFEGFITGNIEYGRYFEHVMSFLDHKNDDNLLLISYEKLHANPKEGILRIAKFLGEEYYQSLSTDESLLEKIVERTSFDYMKKNIDVDLPHRKKNENASEGSEKEFTFFRKGVVGDGKKSLSPDQLRRLREVATEVMKDSEVLQDWFED